MEAWPRTSRTGAQILKTRALRGNGSSPCAQVTWEEIHAAQADAVPGEPDNLAIKIVESIKTVVTVRDLR